MTRGRHERLLSQSPECDANAADLVQKWIVAKNTLQNNDENPQKGEKRKKLKQGPSTNELPKSQKSLGLEKEPQVIAEMQNRNSPNENR